MEASEWADAAPLSSEQPSEGVDPEIWPCLTSLDEKRRYYPIESYFRESLWDMQQVLGAQALSTIQQVTLLVFKPEALVGRRVERILQFLGQHQFGLIAWRPFAFTRHIVRELWRYQWNLATIDKIDLADRVNGALPTAVVVLRDETEPADLPAAVRLKTLKGAATPRSRDPDSLRSAADAPNRMLTLVHTSEEPADVLRELGIFFDRPVRRSILREVRQAFGGIQTSDAAERCRDELKRLEERAPAHDFDATAAWQRILDLADAQARSQLLEQRRRLTLSGRLEWDRFRTLCSRIGAGEWDVIAVGADAVEHDLIGLSPLINFDTDGVGRWRTGKARLCRDR
jgi:nucleoside diphosphate kinase